MGGLICEDFAYQVPAPEFVLTILKGISHVAPLNADPLIVNEAQPSETMAELARVDELLGKSFQRITLPLLNLDGTADKVTKPSGSKEFYERAGSTDKTLKRYEGFLYDPLADVGKEQIMADIQAWIDAHLETVAPGLRERRNATAAPSQFRQTT